METQITPTRELCFRTIEGYCFFNYSQIVSFEADRNCTLVHLLYDNKPQRLLHSFLEIEQKITECCSFFKCHRSHIINLKYVKQFREKANLLIMEQGEVPISKSYLKEFKERFCR